MEALKMKDSIVLLGWMNKASDLGGLMASGADV